jgi:salicylate hydroxylase
MMSHDTNCEPDESRSVAIIGGGIAGLSLALCLRKRGIPSAIIEQAPGFAVVGGGLQLSPNATRILHRLGLALDLRIAAVRLERRVIRDRSGQLLKSEALGDSVVRRFGAPYYAIHRARLHRLLHAALADTPVTLGNTVTAVRQLAGEAEIERASGRRTRHRLVVGADGINSITRSVVNSNLPVFSGQCVVRAVIELPATRVRALGRAVQVWVGTDSHCVVYPLSHTQVNIVAAYREAPSARESWSFPADLGSLRRRYADWDSGLVTVLDSIQQATCWALHDRPPLQRWSTSNVTLAGDAAHPMLPFLAQGGNQAIEDAAALAVCLWNTPTNRLPRALTSYQNVRRARTAEVQHRSRTNINQVGGDRRTGAEVTSHDWLYGHDAELAALMIDHHDGSAA